MTRAMKRSPPKKWVVRGDDGRRGKKRAEVVCQKCVSVARGAGLDLERSKHVERSGQSKLGATTVKAHETEREEGGAQVISRWN